MADKRSSRHSAVGVVTRLPAGRSGAQIPAWTREFSLFLEPYLHSPFTPLARVHFFFSNYKWQYLVIIVLRVESQSSTANLPYAVSQLIRRQLCIMHYKTGCSSCMRQNITTVFSCIQIPFCAFGFLSSVPSGFCYWGGGHLCGTQFTSNWCSLLLCRQAIMCDVKDETMYILFKHSPPGCTKQ